MHIPNRSIVRGPSSTTAYGGAPPSPWGKVRKLLNLNFQRYRAVVGALDIR